MSERLLGAQGIKKAYAMGGEVLEVLRGVDLALDTGELVAVVGASGSGKSTLLNVLGLLDPPDGGTLTWRGRDLLAGSDRGRALHRRRELGFIFQSYHLVPELTAAENVGLPGRMDLPGGRLRRADRVAREQELLVQVGLTDRSRHRPAQLSGGERQRVAIARALFHRPALVLCDEPTGNLDRETGERVWELLRSLRDQQDTSLLLVTHDERFAATADRMLRLVDGVLQPHPAGRLP
jgi:putative ABC transport system ATP-binding protein